MTHARTISRHVRRYSLLGGVCYLVLAGLTSAHAAPNPSGFHVLSSKATGVKSGQYIEAAVSAAYNHGPTAGNKRIYTKALVPVATATLRRGALAALGAGFMHPGLQLAIMAAGFVWSQQDGIQVEGAPSGGTPGVDDDLYHTPYLNDGYGYATYSGDPIYATPAGAASFINSHVCDVRWYASSCNISSLVSRPDGGFTVNVTYWHNSGYNVNYSTVSNRTSGASVNGEYLPAGTPTYTDATPEQLESLDGYIEPQLYDELYNAGPLPVWQDEITVLGQPATYVQPTGEQAVAPEVATKVGQWGENVAAQLDGDPLPNPEEDADGITAEDKIAEELDLDGEIPPFGDPEIDWQVETIDAMPSWSAGIGEATCPPPTVISLWSGLSFEVSYSPLCDFAGFIRAVVIGCAGIVALYIVLGSRS